MDQTKTTHRFAELDDLGRLVELNIDQEEEYREINEQLFTELIPQKRVIVAESEDKIVAVLYWATNFLERTNIWYLDQITVDKTNRHKGIGVGLLKYFLDHAKTQKTQKVFAIVHNDNNPSLEMCRNAGGIASGSIEGLSDSRGEDKRTVFRWEFIK